MLFVSLVQLLQNFFHFETHGDAIRKCADVINGIEGKDHQWQGSGMVAKSKEDGGK